MNSVFVNNKLEWEGDGFVKKRFFGLKIIAGGDEYILYCIVFILLYLYLDIKFLRKLAGFQTFLG